MMMKIQHIILSGVSVLLFSVISGCSSYLDVVPDNDKRPSKPLLKSVKALTVGSRPVIQYYHGYFGHHDLSGLLGYR